MRMQLTLSDSWQARDKRKSQTLENAEGESRMLYGKFRFINRQNFKGTHFSISFISLSCIILFKFSLGLVACCCLDFFVFPWITKHAQGLLCPSITPLEAHSDSRLTSQGCHLHSILIVAFLWLSIPLSYQVTSSSGNTSRATRRPASEFQLSTFKEIL